MLGALLVVGGFAAFLVLPSGTACAAFGFESLSSAFSAGGEAGGAVSAGSHVESWTATLAFNTDGSSGGRHAEGSVKDLSIEMPPGLVALPALISPCSHVDFLDESCPPSSAVGSVEFAVGAPLFTSGPLPPSPVFLLEPIEGQVAQLGFHVKEVLLPVTIDVSLSPRPPYGVVASLTNLSGATELLGLTFRLDGAPGGGAFLVLPRSCARPLRASFMANSWEDPADVVLATAPEPQPVVGCESVPYSPSLQVAPTTGASASPSGLDLTLDVPDPGISSVGGRAAADTESATLTLPSGLTINPSAAAGLMACTSAQLSAETPDSEPGQGCPEASRIGSATVTTPLFSKPIGGSIYLAEPDGAGNALSISRSGTRIALDLVFRDAERGILLPLPLQVDADPDTGRLTASLEQIPQLPVSHVELHFHSGPRAPLTTPATCGSEAIDYSLTPSSGNSPAIGSDTFAIVAVDCGPRFAPSLSAGTVSPVAGRSAPFVFELSQDAAAPNPSGLSLTLPAGLSAAFGTSSLCPDSEAEGGDCPSGSKLGYARIAIGSGPEPLWVPPGEQPDSAVFLAGPYRGAPYSFVIVIPAAVGPFDLGTVVLRAPITIDSVTGQASLSVEGLPQILDGVPLRYRTIRVVLDRPGFIRNPTSCEPTEITGIARAANGSSAAISDRFQAADCAALRFKPRLSLRLSGAIGRNGHPAVRAVLRTDPDGAAISSANIMLPAGELLDLHHLRRLCPRDVTVERCPKGSLLGHLRLATPLLDDPLEGPVYLRVPQRRLPELIAELHSGQLSFVIRGHATDANGRFGVSLESIPDVPVSEAVLSLPGGRNGIVVNSRSLCSSTHRAAGSFVAHNGKRLRLGIRAHLKGHC